MRLRTAVESDPVGATVTSALLEKLSASKEHRKGQLFALLFDQSNQSGANRVNADSFVNCHDLGFGARVAVALLAHRLRAAVLAAESGDEILFQESRSPDFRLRNVAFTSKCPTVGISQAVLTSNPPKLGDTPSFLLNTESTTSPSPERMELVEASIENVLAFGGATVLSALGVIVMMREREVFAQSNSWTMTSVDGTVYTDFVNDPIALGCEIIHESSHLWLNELFAVCGFPFENTETFFSPWKGTQRPRFGFLHAVFAFSMVACYCHAVLKSGLRCTNDDFVYLMLQKQIRHLQSVHGELSRALLPLNGEPSNILLAVLNSALEARKL